MKTAMGKLVVDITEFIAIHKLCAYDASRWRLGIPKYDESTCTMICVPHTTISHEVHLKDKTLGASTDDLGHPDQDIAILIQLNAASAIGRNSGTRCFYFQNDLYYVLSWTDIAGPGHGKRCGLRRIQSDRVVLFLQEITNPDYQQLLYDSIADKIKF